MLQASGSHAAPLQLHLGTVEGWVLLFIMLRTEVDTKSPGTAKTLRIMLYAQNWGRLPMLSVES